MKMQATKIIGAGLPIQIKKFTLFYCTFIDDKNKILSKNIFIV